MRSICLPLISAARLPVILLAVSLCTPALARQGSAPWSFRAKSADLSPVKAFRVPAIDPEVLVARDGGKVRTFPFQFAEPYDTLITSADRGTWDVLADGSRLWRLRISAPGATDLNLGFSSFRLPKGATMHLIGEGRYYQGPYTQADSERHGEFWTPVVPGSRLTVEVHVPAHADRDPKLAIRRVGRGYRDFFKTAKNALPKQGSCNNDVVCPEGDPWRDQIRSVAVYQLEGFWTCTGTLIRDVPGSFTPYFLTAYHCGVDANNDSSMVVYWNFESPSCGDLSNGSLNDNQSGAIFRASRLDVDMCLVELEEEPDPVFDVHFAGWDRSGTTPSGSVGIHHPNTDEKAISFNTDALATVGNCIDSGINTHWEVDDWEDGTTEPGSSGSGLWNSDNKLLIGFLSGGTAACNNPGGSDCYGKFSEAWDGPSASQRLRDWLDPAGAAPLTVNGADAPSGRIDIRKTVYAGHDAGAGGGGSDSLGTTNGAAVTYHVVISNAGTDALSSVLLEDDALGWTDSIGSLSAGSAAVRYRETFLTNSMVNTAVVTATSASSGSLSASDTAAAGVVPGAPVLLAPQAGDLLTGGSSFTLRWSTGGVPAGIDIEWSWTDNCSGESADFFDDMENGVNGWTTQSDAGGDAWGQVTDQAFSPDTSWFAPDVASISDQSLATPALAVGDDASLSIRHSYSMEEGFDGGVIEISTAGLGGPWSDLGSAVTQNGYTDTISTDYSSPIGGQPAFSGSSGGFLETIIDLSAYAGQTVHIRFRLACDSSVAGTGWWVDDVGVNLSPQVWTSLPPVDAAPGQVAWTVPSPAGTDYCVRARFLAADIAGPWSTGGAFTVEASSGGSPVAGSPWINEIHYDNAGTDTGEGIEIAGPAGLDLSPFSLVLYNGSTDQQYDTQALSGSIDDESCGFGAVWFGYPVNGIQNGAPDGIALVSNGTDVIEFLSYEGSVTPVDGPAAGVPGTDIGVSQSSGTAPSNSLQRIGSGHAAADFSWTGPTGNSKGDLNKGQTISPCGGLDDDGDGLPNAWENLYFGGTTNAVADKDDDGDGLDNYGEFIAGTDPNDSDSGFRIRAYEGADTGEITIPARANRQYVLFVSTNLAADSWQPIRTNAALSDGDFAIGVTNPVPIRYYRVRVEPAP